MDARPRWQFYWISQIVLVGLRCAGAVTGLSRGRVRLGGSLAPGRVRCVYSRCQVKSATPVSSPSPLQQLRHTAHPLVCVHFVAKEKVASMRNLKVEILAV